MSLSREMDPRPRQEQLLEVEEVSGRCCDKASRNNWCLQVRRALFGLLFFSLALPGLCVVCMVCRFMFMSGNMSMPTRIIVLADTFWKASFYTFLCIGAMTLASVVVVHMPEVDHADDWVSNFWALDWQCGPIRVNIKGWQAMGFILRPLGLFVLGGFLFVSQIVLEEHIYSGNWLQDELTMNEKDSMYCYFMEQVDWETAKKDQKNLMRLTNGMKVPEFSNMDSDCMTSRSCKLDHAKIKYKKVQTTDLLGWITALWGFRIRRAPPSKCYLADQIQPVPAFNVPLEDFSAQKFAGKDAEPDHLRFAPAYVGADGWWWGNFTMYFAEDMQTACHYECVSWGDSTAVQKLLEIGMVLGGGYAILLFANEVGHVLGNSLVDRDMKPARLTEVVIKDFRVLYYAIPATFRALWTGTYREQFYGKFMCVTLQATFWILVKLASGCFLVLTYRSLVVRFSESLADRGLIRCLIYVSLFNVTLRTIFCFTRDMWHDGEDNGFHKMDKSTNEGKVERHLISFDLYNWMKLNATEVLDFLFDYIYNLGKEELESDKDINVKMIFNATEDQYEIQVGAEGTIKKTKGYGATFEGNKVFVHFHSGVKSAVSSDRPPRDAGKGDRSKGGGKSPESPSRRSYEPKVYKIPVDPTYLTERNELVDDAQESLMKFLGLEHPPPGLLYNSVPVDDVEAAKGSR